MPLHNKLTIARRPFKQYRHNRLRTSVFCTHVYQRVRSNWYKRLMVHTHIPRCVAWQYGHILPYHSAPVVQAVVALGARSKATRSGKRQPQAAHELLSRPRCQPQLGDGHERNAAYGQCFAMSNAMFAGSGENRSGTLGAIIVIFLEKSQLFTMERTNKIA